MSVCPKQQSWSRFIGIACALLAVLPQLLYALPQSPADIKGTLDFLLNEGPGQKDQFEIDPVKKTPRITSNGGRTARSIAFDALRKNTAKKLAAAIQAHQAWLKMHSEAGSWTTELNAAFEQWLQEPFQFPESRFWLKTADATYIESLENVGYDFEESLRNQVWDDRSLPNEGYPSLNNVSSSLALHDAVLFLRGEQANVDAAEPHLLIQSVMEAFSPFTAPAATSGSLRAIDRYGSPQYKAKAAAAKNQAPAPPQAAATPAPNAESHHEMIGLRPGYYVPANVPTDRKPDDTANLIRVSVKGNEITVESIQRVRRPGAKGRPSPDADKSMPLVKVIFHGIYSSNPLRGDSGGTLVGMPMTVIGPERYLLGTEGLATAYFNRLQDSAQPVF
jgi:hypothetical protein